MNRRELKERLMAEGVDKYDYYIVGVDTGEIYGRGELVLEPERQRWHVFAAERGKDYDHRYFDTEDEACRHALAVLTRKYPMAPPLTPEERQAALEASRRLVERLDDELEQRRRSQ